MVTTLVLFRTSNASIQVSGVMLFYLTATLGIRGALKNGHKLQFNLPQNRQILYPETKKICF
jgi:hypothetical protein